MTRPRFDLFAGMTLVIAVLCLAAPDSRADEFKNPKANIPPKAAPQRRNAGEGMAPLPLPATPLRRSEKKREPSPPALVGNITFSAASLKGTGVTWETTIIDIEKWVDFTNANLGQRYRFVGTDFGKFSYDPAEFPIIYFTGWKPLPQFDDATMQKLRGYLMDGGTWVVHSNCGRPEFNESFRREIRRIFPDRELAAIPTDHPLFSSFHHISEMRVRKGLADWQTVPPYLEVINIGTRAAVIFSPIDMSCGWDANANPIEGGVLYDQNDSLKMGANIVTYALGRVSVWPVLRPSESVSPGDRRHARSTRAWANRAQRRLGRHPAWRAESAEDHRSIHHAACAVQARAGRSGEGRHFQLPGALDDRPAHLQLLPRNAQSVCGNTSIAAER